MKLPSPRTPKLSSVVVPKFALGGYNDEANFRIGTLALNHMMDAVSKPRDAVARSWVDRSSPKLQPYLRLMRLDRPIGSWLLFWPCVFGLGLGGMAGGQTRHIGADLWFIALFAVGAIVMRGAGC